METMKISGENNVGGNMPTPHIKSLWYAIAATMVVHHLLKDRKMVVVGGEEDIQDRFGSY